MKTYSVNRTNRIIGEEFVGRGENNRPRYNTIWPDYGVGYKSIKILRGFDEVNHISIINHEEQPHLGLSELEELLLPVNDKGLKWLTWIQIIGTSMKSLRLPDGLDKLSFVNISLSPSFENLLLGKEPPPLQDLSFLGITNEVFRLPKSLRNLIELQLRNCDGLKDVYLQWDTASW